MGVTRTVWSIVRHLRPGRAVETGVARGLTTSVLLEAMERNGHGALWSVDLPDLHLAWQGSVSSAVPAALRGRWTYIRGASRRRLPQVLKSFGYIDLFLPDELHTYVLVCAEEAKTGAFGVLDKPRPGSLPREQWWMNGTGPVGAG